MRLITEMHVINNEYALPSKMLVCLELTDELLANIRLANKAVLDLHKKGLRSPNIEFGTNFKAFWNFPAIWDDLHPEGYMLRRRTGYEYMGEVEDIKGYSQISVWDDSVYLEFSEEYGDEWESLFLPMDLFLEKEKVNA